MIRPILKILVSLLVIITSATFVSAQENDQARAQAEEEKSWVLAFIEQKLSTPNHQIRLENIDGALSSNASIGLITIADRQGIWLKIHDAHIDWERLEMLRGRIAINSLSAQRIEILRRPLKEDRNLFLLGSRSFFIPQLPVGIQVKQLETKRLILKNDVLGHEYAASLNGTFTLDDGALQTNLAIKRLGDQGGEAKLQIEYMKAGEVIKIDFDVNEPENGILANLLNFEGHPAIHASIKGEGSVDLLDVDINMAADGRSIITGIASLHKSFLAGDDAHLFNLNMNGDVAALMPQTYRPLLGTQLAVRAAGVLPAEGGWLLNNFDIEGASLSMQVKAAASTDGFLRQLSLDANFVSSGAERLILPVKGGTTTIDSATLTIAYGQSETSAWTGKLTIRDFVGENLSVGDISLDMGGVAENLDNPDKRHIDFIIHGTTHDLHSSQLAIIDALGAEPNLSIDMSWRSLEAFKINNVLLSGKNLALQTTGEIENWQFDGQIKIETGENASSRTPTPSQLDTNNVTASQLTLEGKIALLSGAFDLNLQGSGHNIRSGISSLDKILVGDVILSGGIARDEIGIHADNFIVRSEYFNLAAKGTMGQREADMEVDFSLSNLALLDERINGVFRVRAAARGSNGVIALGAHGDIEQSSLADHLLENASLDFNAILDNSLPYQPTLLGQMKGQGQFDGQPLEFTSLIENKDKSSRLDKLNLTLGEATLSGALVYTNDKGRGGIFDGALHLEAQDISSLSALLLQKGSGALAADIVLRPDEEKQHAEIIAKFRDVIWREMRAEKLDIHFSLNDIFTHPQADGRLEGYNIALSELQLDHLYANSRIEDMASHITATAQLRDKTQINLETSLTPRETKGWSLKLTRAEMRDGLLDISLKDSASIHFLDAGKIDIDPFFLDVEGGSLQLKGAITEQLDIELAMNDLPLALTNLVAPDMQAQGRVNGRAHITGTTVMPILDFKLDAQNVSARPLKQNAIAPFAASLEGTTSNGMLEIIADINSVDAMRAGARGHIGLVNQQLDIDIDIKHLPIAMFNERLNRQNLNGQNLSGVVSGNLHMGGSFTQAEMNFDLMAQDISSQFLSENGLAPLAGQAKGHFTKQSIVFDTFQVSGPQELNLQAAGLVPFIGNGIDLVLDGSAPLALANRFLGSRGASAAGQLQINARIGGALSTPRLDGHFSILNGSFIDAQTNAGLKNISSQGRFDGEHISLNLTAQSASGGELHASGNISTNIAEGMPASLDIQLDRSRYNDGSLVLATLNGHITIKGPLLRDFEIGGDVLVDKAEITVPSSFGGVDEIQVDHKNVTPPVAATLARANMEIVRSFEGRELHLKRTILPRLNLIIRAPSQIFVRGRGLDAELGGRIHLEGGLDSIRPTGSFNLIRGRFDILTKRLNFDEGRVGLSGTLNPELDFTASTQGNGIHVIVSLSGQLDKLILTFSSQPELPQDEVLAFLIFNRSISELSPLQIAQLAAAAAELTGLTQSSLMGNLRGLTGLDDLDITSDGQGKTAVRAGRYIRDNIYLGVEADSQGKTKGTINLDIGEDLKIKGAVGSDSNSSLGLFYEKDY